MPLGTDKQYDATWEEQDKIRRRLEIKDRLKQEGIRRKWDPYLHIKGEKFTDPALDRYADLRKKGRMPGTPLKPQVFFGLLSFVFVPIIFFWKASDWERGDMPKRRALGDIPYKDIPRKHLG